MGSLAKSTRGGHGYFIRQFARILFDPVIKGKRLCIGASGSRSIRSGESHKDQLWSARVCSSSVLYRAPRFTRSGRYIHILGAELARHLQEIRASLAAGPEACWRGVSGLGGSYSVQCICSTKTSVKCAQCRCGQIQQDGRRQSGPIRWTEFEYAYAAQ